MPPAQDNKATGTPATASSGQNRLRLPAHQESLPRLRELALAWAHQAGLPNDVEPRVDLVLEEMLMNIFHYAYPSELGDVELALLSPGQGDSPGRLSLTLTDWGVPFDPLAPEDPGLEAGLEANLDADLDDRALGGMGLFLLRTLAKASYARLGDANVLTLAFGA
ncbi:MAG: ATP-binding protein [Proteobacteria bacterium]|nr:ATP-binding protein [Pseudomonadota bacterium]